MTSGIVRLQLVLFAVATVVGIGVITLVYARLPATLGITTYPVSARFTEGAGLYPGANVTYRGVTVGEVTEVEFGERFGTVDVEMSLDSSQEIPTDVRASIRQVSAIGEQHVELSPRHDGPPYLASGSTIPLASTRTFPGIGPVLDETDELLSTLPRDSLRTTLAELGYAFDRTGPHLRSLLGDSRTLVGTANRNYEQTEQLINDLGPLLRTQQVSDGAIRRWTRDLAVFTDQVRASDAEIRSLLHKGPPFARVTTRLFQDMRPTLPILLANLTSIGEVLVTYNPAIEQVAVLYPAVVAAEQSAVNGRGGRIAMDFRANLNDPPPCLRGYERAGGQRSPFRTDSPPIPDDLYCRLPVDDISTSRGARNYPCLAVPGKRAPSASLCRRGEFRAQQGSSPRAPGPRPPHPPVTKLTYNPDTGLYRTPDDQFFVFGGVGSDASESERATWRTLMLRPLGQ